MAPRRGSGYSMQLSTNPSTKADPLMYLRVSGSNGDERSINEARVDAVAVNTDSVPADTVGWLTLGALVLGSAVTWIISLVSTRRLLLDYIKSTDRRLDGLEAKLDKVIWERPQ